MRAVFCAATLTLLIGPALWAQQRLELPNETTIELVRDAQGNCLGVGAVRICGIPVSQSASPALPEVQTRGGAEYGSWRVETVDAGARCAVVGKLVDRRTSREDQLRLILRPEEMAIGGRWYFGFAYQYVFDSELDEVLRIIDRTHLSTQTRDIFVAAQVHAVGKQNAVSPAHRIQPH